MATNDTYKVKEKTDSNMSLPSVCGEPRDQTAGGPSPEMIQRPSLFSLNISKTYGAPIIIIIIIINNNEKKTHTWLTFFFVCQRNSTRRKKKCRGGPVHPHVDCPLLSFFSSFFLASTPTKAQICSQSALLLSPTHVNEWVSGYELIVLSAQPFSFFVCSSYSKRSKKSSTQLWGTQFENGVEEGERENMMAYEWPT